MDYSTPQHPIHVQENNYVELTLLKKNKQSDLLDDNLYLLQ